MIHIQTKQQVKLTRLFSVDITHLKKKLNTASKKISTCKTHRNISNARILSANYNKIRVCKRQNNLISNPMTHYKFI